MSTPTIPNRTRNRLLTLIGALLLVTGVFGSSQQANARLDPFFIVRGNAGEGQKPRILFLIDNSGSMAMDVTYKPLETYKNTKCWWDNCEDDDAGMLQSRVHTARNVIKELYEANKDNAEFALMTFATALPASDVATTPEPCIARSTGGGLIQDQAYRFTWVENVNQPYSSIWKPASNTFGGQGFWLLCGDNRPFPYLRHDDLGFSLPNNSDAPLLDEPLYRTHADLLTFEDGANRSREVQFFPRFLGRRVHLDCADAYEESIVANSWGDYGNTDVERNAGVCGHDFYYWPYVDGNPGYSFYDALSEDDMSFQRCNDNGSCSTKTNQIHRTGTTRRRSGGQASLYAPFYSEAVVNDPGVAWSEKGPRDIEDQELMFNGAVAKNYAGGVDVAGGTPLGTALWVPEYAVTTSGGAITGLKPAVPLTNRPFSHTTVASYLAFMRVAEPDALCRPLSLIIVSDGQPSPWDPDKIYPRLRSIRRVLGVKSYFVAFTEEIFNDPTNEERVHHMACAASGADSAAAPCDGGNTFSEWDTCADPDNPATGCAWLTTNQEELAAALSNIITASTSLDVPSGTPQVANDFQLSDPNDPESSQAAVQTSISSWTEVPAWKGHVVRGGCTDEDPDNPGQLAEYCANANDVTLDTEEVETFGPCPLGRVWDAGACLASTTWSDRRIYTHDYDNNVFRISDGAGAPTADFISLVTLLDSQGKISPALSTDGATKAAEITAMAEWLLGKDMPSDWKLPGVPNSAPVLIRRVPQYDGNFLPTVGIRDPHCAGRRNVTGENVPPTLEAFSSQAWGVTSGNGYDTHYDYTEAVLFGDDNGVLHAVHYNSGNELFGFVPLALLNNARTLSVAGPDNMGQASDLGAHVFGIASTINNGWAWDEDDATWRHLAVFGLGPGGTEIMTLDVSHMGRLQTDDPVEVVWTTSTTANASDYADTLGQTWSRPALTYAVPNDSMSGEPKAYMVFGSGYRDGVGTAERGRTVWVVDAITGETVTQQALMSVPDPATIYDAEDDYSAVSDVAVSSHCLSRYWGEMQEAYWADPAGRLFRWDLQASTNDPTVFPHTGDSGSLWDVDVSGVATSEPAYRFPACQGTDDFNCTIGSIAGGAKGDVFTFSPAVVANNRLDGPNDNGGTLPMGDRDQFLIALISGNPNDIAVDGSDEDNDFHSSLYLLADDHRGDQSAGFTIPANAPTVAPGDQPFYMRLPLSQIERTRTIYYPNGDVEDETRTFSKRARPLKAPMIRVTGLLSGGDQAGEVFYVTYTVYEPGNGECDSRWYDSDLGEFINDPGATYEISFRLVVADGETFEFDNGFPLPGDYGDGFGTSGSLGDPVVNQIGCEGENCGAALRAPSQSPCDPNVNPPQLGGAISVQTGWAVISGFTPLELDL